MRRVIWILVTGSFVLTILYGCTTNKVKKDDNTLIEERINCFVVAYNAGDMDTVLECLDSKTRNMYMTIMNIGIGVGLDIGNSVGVSSDINLSDLFGIGVGSVSEENIMDIENMSISISNENKAIAELQLSYKDHVSNYSDLVYVSLVKENDDWFINNMESK